MNRTVKYMLYFAALIVLMIGTAYITYAVSDNTLENAKTSVTDVTQSESSKKATYNSTTEDNPPEPVVSKGAVFEFEETQTGKTGTIRNITAPQEFVGYNEKTLAETYGEWDIVDFAENKVHFKRRITVQEPIYVLTSQNDELVVYYKDSDGNVTLEEETGVNISVLPEADIEKIKQGIVYKDKNDVMMALQNYDS